MSRIPDWSKMPRDERIDAIKPLAAKGFSAGQIAREFLNASRNAIIGYCKRYNISLKNSPGSPPDRKRSPKMQARVERAENPVVRIPAAKPAREIPDVVALAPISKSKAFDPIEGVKPVHLENLSQKQCHWPVNGLEGIEPIFCGITTRHLYCSSHQRLAYVPR